MFNIYFLIHSFIFFGGRERVKISKDRKNTILFQILIFFGQFLDKTDIYVLIYIAYITYINLNSTF